jgi:hypothetical protein
MIFWPNRNFFNYNVSFVQNRMAEGSVRPGLAGSANVIFARLQAPRAARELSAGDRVVLFPGDLIKDGTRIRARAGG